MGFEDPSRHPGQFYLPYRSTDGLTFEVFMHYLFEQRDESNSEVCTVIESGKTAQRIAGLSQFSRELQSWNGTYGLACWNKS